MARGRAASPDHAQPAGFGEGGGRALRRGLGLAAQLARIAGALERLEQGEYGYCVNCSEPIAPKRLELDPATPLCVNCAGRSG